MGYRLKGKRFHLTYAQCTLPPTRLYEFLSTLGKDVVRCRIACELHKDGSEHRHVAIQFSNAWDRTNAATFFDCDGHHPNIKPKRTKPEWIAAWNYGSKDGNYTDWGDPETETGDTPKENIVDVAERLNSSDYREFIRYCDDHNKNWHLAKEAWRAVHGTSAITITDDNASLHLRDRSISSVLLRHMPPSVIESGLSENAEPKTSLCIRGPPGCGKTTWALTHAPRPCLWCRGIEDIRAYVIGYHQSIILDDLMVRHRPRTDQLNIVDRQCPMATLWGRYSDIHLDGVPRVFTFNHGHDPVDFYDGAIARRCFVVEIEEGAVGTLTGNPTIEGGHFVR